MIILTKQHFLVVLFFRGCVRFTLLFCVDVNQRGGHSVGGLWSGDGTYQPTDQRIQSLPVQRGEPALYQRVNDSLWDVHDFGISVAKYRSTVYSWVVMSVHAVKAKIVFVLISQMLHSQLWGGCWTSVSQTPGPCTNHPDGNVSVTLLFYLK